jgi:2-oxoacid:acceptor oxidoreductase delta subunit (pyruvate/2-ketoisovalerate family)
MAIDAFFKGKDSEEAIVQNLIGEGPSISIFGYLHPGEKLRNPHVVAFEELNMDYFEPAKRQGEAKRSVKERIKGFKEISSTLSEGIAQEEAERCFNCGTCNRCEICYVFCPDASVLKREEILSHEVDYDYCKGCGICFTECPRGAISLKEEAR